MFKTGGKTFNKEKDKNSYEFARSTKSTTATVDRTVLLTETADKMTDLGDIRRPIGPRKRFIKAFACNLKLLQNLLVNQNTIRS